MKILAKISLLAVLGYSLTLAQPPTSNTNLIKGEVVNGKVYDLVEVVVR